MKDKAMNIQLKQNEIIAALRMYVVAQGINLQGKHLEITFTAGRKEAGLIADLTIEDAVGSVVNTDIPGFTHGADTIKSTGPVTDAATTVTTTNVAAESVVVDPAPSAAASDPTPAPVAAVKETAAEVVEVPAAAADPAKPVASLFGN